MLSIRETRDLIEGDEENSDVGIERIEDDMRNLGEVTFESWMKEKSRKGVHPQIGR